ncbi:MAG TPA: transcriptional regulator, partial [Bacteroidales bacterium]|nr:transcriptional regulator [Bacteroidales bacterium]
MMAPFTPDGRRSIDTLWRISSQEIMPLNDSRTDTEGYRLYPVHSLGDNAIQPGLVSLAESLPKSGILRVDGDTGVFFEPFVRQLTEALSHLGRSVCHVPVSEWVHPPETVLEMTAPFTGGDDPVFGRRTTLAMRDFFRAGKLESAKPDADSGITIFFGTGAALCPVGGALLYITVPKNEQQYRARAGSIANLGLARPLGSKMAYKRFYFNDWVVVRKHLESIAPVVNYFIDGQQGDSFTWASGDTIRKGLAMLSRSVFRPRPWFEPGAWGGEWCLGHIPGLNTEVPNYAWSFELISPENGVVFESDGNLLEVSFDLLMALEAKQILGQSFATYGTEFPIRFDFLDTYNGGNLSVQCHPRPEYIRAHFGENFTQEEAYYMLDSGDNAVVYLGFQQGINPEEFERILTGSYLHGQPVDIEQFVQKHPAHKHDFFLIPPGTIHASGINNLVLEISTTPYIFTFKMYDWCRPDLDGNPRPLNIARGMENLYFERQGHAVKEDLISKPLLLEKGDGWEMYQLPTHPMHSYEVKRLVITHEINLNTSGQCHVYNLVEGSMIHVVTESGFSTTYRYTETFVVPASTGNYTLINPTDTPVML